MTAFSRSLIAVTAALASMLAVSVTANAFPAAKPGAADAPSNLIKVHDRYDRNGRPIYHRHYHRGRNVVHAPFTRVESGRRTVVDAPFAHVYSDRHGRTHVVAPFVNYWD
ncbi:hypothetical protein [Hyphomicrobium sp. MC8b]|uniref:hypothetical protein n=1 Tax=Hyphomicrobium sp. MC8b TaxID=300273 RepID=UPI00391C5D5B